jgi:superfamily I DNA/RNA helicase
MNPLDDVGALPYLVIDEGQDMPPQFYQTLIKIGFENFYIVADQNQRITDQHSSRNDIELTLVIDTADTLELTTNYRNSRPIARLAHEFYTGDPAVERVELPEPKGGDSIPRMITYGTDAGSGFAGVVEEILKLHDRNRDKLICIITPNDDVRNRFCENLRGDDLPLDHEPPVIQTHHRNMNVSAMLKRTKAGRKCLACGGEMIIRTSDYGAFLGCSNWPQCKFTASYASIDFSNGGIAVINQQSIKGLDFDTVYIADVDAYWCNDKDALMKKFYVMVSRARDDVVLLRTGAISQDVEKILPHDETILTRG